MQFVKQDIIQTNKQEGNVLHAKNMNMQPQDHQNARRVEMEQKSRVTKQDVMIV